MKRERHTQSFYAGGFYIVSSQPNQRAAPVGHKVVWPCPGLNLDSLVRRQELNSLLFLKSQKSSAHASVAWRHSHPLVPISLWDFYFDISEWHILSARAWRPALMLYLTNPFTKRKVLILTKPKGKIYKTKSHRNYITYIYICDLSANTYFVGKIILKRARGYLFPQLNGYKYCYLY